MSEHLPTLRGKRRVMVIGCGGAGKSTFARALAERTSLPLVHLDRCYWNQGWVPTPKDEWIRCVERLAAAETWIIDGNYGGTLELRLARCDAVVVFDLPRLVCLQGVLKRRILEPFRPRTDIPQGCEDRISREFLSWVWTYRERSRPTLLAALEQCPPEVPILMLRSRRQARDLLART